jgi:integrase
MAQFFKRGTNWCFRYYDANGRRVYQTGCPDRRKTEEMATLARAVVSRIRAGLSDSKEEGYKAHEARPMSAHLADWIEALKATGTTSKHSKLFSHRASRVVALIMGAKLSEIEPEKVTKVEIQRARLALAKWLDDARLSDMTADRVQGTLAALKAEGRSLATCNHHRSAIRAFSRWCHNTHRIREDALRGVTGFNAKEDPRHDRRTVSLDELRRLIEATERGPDLQRMTGPARSLCYRLAVASGLRYSELASLYPEAFDLGKAPTVTVQAAYTKNGQTAKQGGFLLT